MTLEPNGFVLWLLTALLHATVLLGLAWLADLALPARSVALRQWLWRTALYGGLFTAALQVGLQTEPLAGRIALPVTERASTAVEETRPAPLPALREASKPTPATPRREVHARSTASIPQRALAFVTRDPATILTLTWLAIVAVALVLAARRAFALRRLLRASRPLADDALDAISGHLADCARIKPPRLRVARVASPLATVGNTVVLPEWSVAHAGAGRIEAMLAHEIAHLQRRDTWWQAFDAGAHALLLIHPFGLHARRRLEALAELAADAWAARTIGGGRALAEGLAQCAEHVSEPAHAALATAMASARSPLVHRIERLLNEDIMNPEFRIPGLRALALVAIVAAAVVLPSVGTRVNAAETEEDGNDIVTGSWHTTTDWGFGETMRAGLKRPGYELSVKAQGKFEFNEDESDIAEMEDGATLSMKETTGGHTRLAEYESDDGTLTRTFTIDGDPMSDADAQQWLTRAIPEMLRQTGFDAERRTQRILAKGGVDAVLAEVDKIGGDFARRVYLTTLAENAKLDARQFDAALAYAADIDSDFERRTTLTGFLATQDAAPATQVKLLEATTDIGSDFEKRTVLEEAVDHLADDAAVRDAWQKAASSIDSDFERRTAISGLAERDDLGAEWTLAAIRATSGISSDFEARTSLESLAERIGSSPELVEAYTAVAADIDSDFERRTSLVALVEEAELNTDGYRGVIRAASGMGDFECRQVLEAVAEKMPADAGLISDYRRVARQLGDHERGQAERALDRFEI